MRKISSQVHSKLPHNALEFANLRPTSVHQGQRAYGQSMSMDTSFVFLAQRHDISFSARSTLHIDISMRPVWPVDNGRLKVAVVAARTAHRLIRTRYDPRRCRNPTPCLSGTSQIGIHCPGSRPDRAASAWRSSCAAIVTPLYQDGKVQ